jgi:hypothetical protein
MTRSSRIYSVQLILDGYKQSYKVEDCLIVAIDGKEP